MTGAVYLLAFFMKRQILAIWCLVGAGLVVAGPREYVVLDCVLTVLGLGWALVDGVLEIVEVLGEEGDSSDEDLLIEYHEPYEIDPD